MSANDKAMQERMQQFLQTWSERLSSRSNRAHIGFSDHYLCVSWFDTSGFILLSGVRVQIAGASTGQVSYYRPSASFWRPVEVDTESNVECRRELIALGDWHLVLTELIALQSRIRGSVSTQPEYSGVTGITNFQRIGTGNFSEDTFNALMPPRYSPVLVLSKVSGPPFMSFPLRQTRQMERLHIYTSTVLPAPVVEDYNRTGYLNIGVPISSSNGVVIGELVVGGSIPYLLMTEDVAQIGWMREKTEAKHVVSQIVKVLSGNLTGVVSPLSLAKKRHLGLLSTGAPLKLSDVQGMLELWGEAQKIGFL